MYYLNLADFVVEFNNKHEYLFWRSKEYQVSDPEQIDFCVTIPVELIDDGIRNTNNAKGLVEGMEMQRSFSEWLPLRNAFLMHSVVVDVDGTGVTFAAHSGTGKTTHMRLWQEYLGERMTVVNGDKPFVRFFDDEPTVPYAYGTPWNGKERLGCNMRTPLKHICFITRAKENQTVPITKQQALPRILNQVYMPKDPAAMAATLQLINRLLDSVQLWEIQCNMDIDAAKIAYNAIFGASNAEC